MPSFLSYERAVIGKPLLRQNCVLRATAHDRFQEWMHAGVFRHRYGKQDLSNLQSFKGSIGAGTRRPGQEPSSRGAEEKTAKVPSVVERVGENTVGSRPGMRCRSRWRLKKRSAMGCARVRPSPDAIVVELASPIRG